jgi:hypothetical protein
MNKNEKFYAVYKNDLNNTIELWSGLCSTKEGALCAGEMRVLDTYGSKSNEYMRRVNGLFAVNESEAAYMKVA